ncbi:MAG: hypothetical protein ACK4UY_07410 [Dietzia sp.]
MSRSIHDAQLPKVPMPQAQLQSDARELAKKSLDLTPAPVAGFSAEGTLTT